MIAPFRVCGALRVALIGGSRELLGNDVAEHGGVQLGALRQVEVVDPGKSGKFGIMALACLAIDFDESVDSEPRVLPD